MRRRLLLVVAVLVLVAMGVQPVVAIGGGQYDDPLDPRYPQVGAMVVVTQTLGTWMHCSGTLIHERVFLTAGHCYAGFPPTGPMFYVTFDTDAMNEQAWIEVAEIIRHPGYQDRWNNLPHDVAVLILAEPVTDITPANLPSEGFLDTLREEGKLVQGPDGAHFTVVGYGATPGWPPPVYVHEDQRQYALVEYKALLKSWLALSERLATDDGGVCFGDSGGPAFWEEDGTETLVGINSWGDSICVASLFSYRVDIADTLDFIEGVIAGL